MSFSIISISLSQLSLAILVLIATVGNYVALSPPNRSTKPMPLTGDMVRRLNLTNQRTTSIGTIPLGFLALYNAYLICLYPDISPSALRYGAANGLNMDLVTWSTATFIPLTLILFVGVPLRLVAYSSLGKNFTFELAEPDGLKTTGIYRYVQHPSYTGIVVLMASDIALLGRLDGAISCWVRPEWYGALQTLGWALLTPTWLSLSLFALWTRVQQEERMLQAKFGVDWEKWHAKTSRFIPWLF
ncbi:hypothetical protein F4804DRAFT_305928 [Jackrogersella minutella]|nr:hypothetical protein F4804DRAFT_305928 [Jackrogersella minutella]